MTRNNILTVEDMVEVVWNIMVVTKAMAAVTAAVIAAATAAATATATFRRRLRLQWWLRWWLRRRLRLRWWLRRWLRCLSTASATYRIWTLSQPNNSGAGANGDGTGGVTNALPLAPTQPTSPGGVDVASLQAAVNTAYQALTAAIATVMRKLSNQLEISIRVRKKALEQARLAGN